MMRPCRAFSSATTDRTAPSVRAGEPGHEIVQVVRRVPPETIKILRALIRGKKRRRAAPGLAARLLRASLRSCAAITQPGTVTFLFTDVEGSTKLLEEIGDRSYDQALAEHRRIVRAACAGEGGVEGRHSGRCLLLRLPGRSRSTRSGCTQAGPVSATRGTWARRCTSPPVLRRPATVDIVLSKATAELVDGSLTELGEHRLKDIAEPPRLRSPVSAIFGPLRLATDCH